ncbi:NTP transferase domain-containing protein [Candidatus Woesearchaeota archaeon]|nr:NTP transferase domain-containing protein [Candidatus Woesearchaeota archaeon]
MKALILAAGKGTRMHPLTLDTPKPLIEVGGIPLMQHSMQAAYDFVDEYVIVVKYLKEQIMAYFGKEFKGKPISYVVQEETLGTGHALLSAQNELGGEEFLILLGDDIISPAALSRLVKQDKAVLLRETPDPRQYAVVELNEKGHLQSIEEKPLHPKTNLANTGAWKMNAALIEHMKDKGMSERGEYEITDALASLMKEETIAGVRAKEKEWLGVGTLEELSRAREYMEGLFAQEKEVLSHSYYFSDLSACPCPELLQEGEYPWQALEKLKEYAKGIKTSIKGEVHPSAVLSGEVEIGEGSIISPYAVIEGPVKIGKNVLVRPFALLRPNTLIGDDVVVGNAAEIKQCIIFNEAKVQSHTFVGDGILGKGARIGSGAILSNRRFDQETVKVTIFNKRYETNLDKCSAIVGDYVRIGSQVNTAPGTLIGNNAWVGAGVCLKGFVEKNKFVQLRQDVETVAKKTVLLEGKNKEGER